MAIDLVRCPVKPVTTKARIHISKSTLRGQDGEAREGRKANLLQGGPSVSRYARLESQDS